MILIYLEKQVREKVYVFFTLKEKASKWGLTNVSHIQKTRVTNYSPNSIQDRILLSTEILNSGGVTVWTESVEPQIS